MLRYRLSYGAAIVLEKGDITKYKGDAIVNAANSAMLGGGGVDGAIHRAAGPKLVEACRKVPPDEQGDRCPTGQARLTEGFNLPARYVIHTVGPIYQDPEKSAPLLASAYRESIKLAAENNITTLAFPALSCGVFGYPLDEAAEIALSTVKDTAKDPLRQITFMLFGNDVFAVFQAQAERLGLVETEAGEKTSCDIN